MYDLLKYEPIDDLGIEEEQLDRLREIADIFGEPEPALLHLFWDQGRKLTRGIAHMEPPPGVINFFYALYRFGLVLVEEERANHTYWCKCTESGRDFLLHLAVVWKGRMWASRVTFAEPSSMSLDE